MLSANIEGLKLIFFFFVPADKQESFLQSDSVTLGVRSQACSKYLKQVYNIVTISQGKHEE